MCQGVRVCQGVRRLRFDMARHRPPGFEARGEFDQGVDEPVGYFVAA